MKKHWEQISLSDPHFICKNGLPERVGDFSKTPGADYTLKKKSALSGLRHVTPDGKIYSKQRDPPGN